MASFLVSDGQSSSSCPFYPFLFFFAWRDAHIEAREGGVAFTAVAQIRGRVLLVALCGLVVVVVNEFRKKALAYRA
jgi:hypothetical protein